MPEHNVYRDGRVHVLEAECGTCIFRPAVRPVSGARVAGMVRETKDTDAATVVCHSTLYDGEPEAHAICRGWWDRFAQDDLTLRLAVAQGIITEQPVPDHEEDPDA